MRCAAAEKGNSQAPTQGGTKGGCENPVPGLIFRPSVDSGSQSGLKQGGTLNVVVRFAAVVAAAVAWSAIRAEAAERYATRLAGDIDESDVALIKSVPDGATIALDSSGGSISLGIEIGRLIRKKRLAVEVPDGARCLSSCALLYIGGVDRSNLGRIGLHRPYLVGQPYRDRQIERGLPRMFADVREFVAQMGVTATFADVMINTPSDSMRVFLGDEIRELVPDRDPVFDELRVATEARTRGMPTELFRQLEAQANRECGGAKDDATVACHDAILARRSATNQVAPTGSQALAGAAE
jgi:hypothetical protein